MPATPYLVVTSWLPCAHSANTAREEQTPYPSQFSGPDCSSIPPSHVFQTGNEIYATAERRRTGQIKARRTGLETHVVAGTALPRSSQPPGACPPSSSRPYRPRGPGSPSSAVVENSPAEAVVGPAGTHTEPGRRRVAVDSVRQGVGLGAWRWWCSSGVGAPCCPSLLGGAPGAGRASRLGRGR